MTHFVRMMLMKWFGKPRMVAFGQELAIDFVSVLTMVAMSSGERSAPSIDQRQAIVEAREWCNRTST